MTKEEYRQHMREYSRDTAVMSYTVTKHPDYQAMKEAGEEIIPYLFADMLDSNWHCSHCYGEGFEFPADWVWDNEKRNWPTDTGIPCAQCNGKGNVSSWGCMTLLWEAVGRDNGPKVEDWMRGRHDVLVRQWCKWGEQRGYLPPTPGPSRLEKLGRLIFGIVKLWSHH